MTEELILDAKGVHAWYGSSHILHGIDLRIERGQTVGLLGRNGMGKSTLIRTLLGHVAQRSGEIHFLASMPQIASLMRWPAWAYPMYRKVGVFSPIFRCWKTYRWPPA